ncbi:hypothetical protein H9P43_005861 [Blastocladiella emersonii ATCC 22665]|nr:hypothetical protein H9P43_005861 [Blastocladiella emersonii ATCC 22665]
MARLTCRLCPGSNLASPKLQSASFILAYLLFWVSLVIGTFLLYRADLRASLRSKEEQARFVSAPLATNPRPSPALIVDLVVKSVDPLAATALLGFTLEPSDDLVRPVNKARRVTGFMGRPGAIETIDPSTGSDAVLARPTLSRGFTVVIKGVKKTYAAGSRLPNEETLTVPFTRSSIRGYPFDTHTGYVDVSSQVLAGTAGNTTTAAAMPVVVTMDTRASGMKFVRGSPLTPRGMSRGPLFVEIEFQVKRSNITVGFSLFVLSIMWVLSVVIGFLALQVLVQRRPVAAAILGPPISLLFALPSLRNVQPEAPPVGSTVDVLGFFWNMVIVAISAAAIIFTFIHRWQPPSEMPVPPPTRPPRPVTAANRW